jgi:diguanylate cyclase (GGDEF)-like protein
MFVYWGQAFCEGLVNRAQWLIGDQTKEFLNISGNLELKLKYESDHDNLTNLPNNRMLSDQITRAIKQLGSQGRLAVIVIKVNDLNSINYNFGTFNANKLLKEFANKLKAILINPYLLEASLGINMVARLYSNEFAFLLPGLKKDFNADEFATTLLQLVPSSFIIDGIDINCSTSVGIALYPVHGTEDSVLINNASIAVYHAIKEERPYTIYTSEMEDDLMQNRIMINELKRSIEQNELEIYYHPIIELATGTIVGAESLVRFEHSLYGLLSAEKFIPLVEGTSLIHDLTAFMLKEVIKQISSWHNEGYHLSVSVNLSVKDATDRELPDLINKLLADYALAPEFLKLEFTERACLTDQAITKEVLQKIANIGVKLAINDFCSGYTSFIYLTNYPINSVKIEKSYVLKMTHTPQKIKIVEAIIKLAETLGLKTVADGISDRDSLAKLKELGCIYGQGALFSRAVNAADFKKMLDKKMPIE